MANRRFLLAFVFSLFASALLLFLVQPIVAKILLPTLGGTSSVWNTCMFFFQATLLLGYSYAHLSIKFLSNRQQRILHLCVLGLGMLSLPVATAKLSAPDEPLLWIFGVLIVMIAGPFFALSATAPLFQAWFVQSDHPQRKNPYQLYAASNLGSILALLLYPFVFEGLFTIQTQSNIWSVAYLFFFGISVLVVSITWKFTEKAEVEPEAQSAISWDQRLLWVVYAFIPSSLVLGLTTHISINIGAVPLFWVLPLALYLLTFVIAFSSYSEKSSKIWMAAGPVFSMTAFVTLLPVSWLVVVILHLVLLFILSLSFHCRLVKAAPAAGSLTEFYLFMSLGGVLGSSFNAVIAPSIFSGHYEYYIMLGISLLILYDKIVEGFPVTVKGFSLTLTLIALSTGWFVFEKVEGFQSYALLVLISIIALAILFRALPTRRKTLVKISILVWVAVLMGGLGPTHVFQDRSFYSTLRVDLDKHGTRSFHSFAHGNTFHGRQELNIDTLIPLAYYHRSGPLGKLLHTMQKKDAIRIGVVGLGVGALAAYNRPNDHMDFYEIDSAVVDIAKNTKLFTFLSDAEGVVEVVVGDGRMKLETYSGPSYDLLIIDAFSSDAIPTFLLTKEAVQIYLSKLVDDGLLVFHVSSTYLNLEPILGKIAANLGFSSQVLEYPQSGTGPESIPPSKWVIITKDNDTMADFVGGNWTTIDIEETPLWTDAHHNILPTLK